MQYCYDYSIELENMLKKVYENKIYKIAKENNIDNINESNLNSIISIFNKKCWSNTSRILNLLMYIWEVI